MEIQVNVFKVNLAGMTITCECSENDIILAREKYKGIVMEHVREEA